MKLNSLLLVIFFTLSTLVSFSQTKELKKADEAYFAGEYSGAIELYTKAYTKEKSPAVKAEIVFKTAMCYKSISNSRSAEVWFRKAIQVKYPDPVAVLYYADAKKMNSKFDEAVIEYKKYQKLVPDDTRGELGEKSCELVAKWTDKPTRHKVENMAFFNTKYDDFSPAYAKKDYKIVYFSSTRPGAHGDKINIITGQPFTDIFGATKDRKGTWSVPTPLNVEVNSEFDEGASSLNEKANTLYFTRCRYSKSEALGCQVLWAKKRGVGWGEATVIPLAHDSVSVGHPSISKDELTLYFTANIPGGQGGNDIWMIKRVKRTAPWSSDAINLGSVINTSGNEMFPFIHKDGSLYFSSDRHLGMGGLDIFKATKEGDKWSINNIKYPLNTPSDDFGIIFQGTQERGFLTSNRRGGKGGDDIYTFVLPPLKFTLAGVVKDEKTNRYMPGAKVKLIEEGGTIIEATSEADGSFKFKLKPNKNYQISTEMENYLKGRANVSTKNLEDDSEDIQIEVFMSPIEAPIELPHIEYDVAKWDLRPESMVSLNELIKTMDDNSNITIELMSHTDFRPPSGITNMVLSQNRAQSVVDYLIEKGVAAERLTPVGYGATKPKVVDSVTASVNTFLKEGDVLDKPYILKRSTKTEREVCHQLNRRTEFRVLKQNYQPKTDFNTPGGATEGTKPNVEGVKPE